MDQQRPLLYFTLLFLGVLIWTTWQQDHAPKPVAVENATSSQQITNTANQSDNSQDIPNNVTTSSSTVADLPTAAQAVADDEQLIHVKTDVLDVLISTKGASLIQTDLPPYPVSLEEKDHPVRILGNEKSYFAQSGLISTDAALAPNHYAQFTTPQAEYTLTEDSNDLSVPFRWTNNQGLTVTKTFTFKRSSFLINVIEEVNNQTAQVWTGSHYQQLTHSPKSSGPRMMGIQAYVGGAYYNEKYEKISFSDMEDENLGVTIQGGWAAMLEHYFVSAWIPPKEQNNTYYSKFIPDNKRYVLGVKSPDIQVAPGDEGHFNNQLYIGPKIQSDLEKISKGLDLTVDYGIFSFISKPIFWMMETIHNFVGNWGWTIILMTILIKLIFYYPSAISYRSMGKMKKLAPKIKEMTDKLQGDPQAKQKAMMDFYKKEKINPLGGCLPMLIQMPVFMGLYWVLLESVELRQAPWLAWYHDLSVMDPYFILPLIFGASMFIQQKLNPPQMDPMQQKIFAFLPIIFTVMFLFFPAGLVLYWVVNNTLSILQQWYITKQISESN